MYANLLQLILHNKKARGWHIIGCVCNVGYICVKCIYLWEFHNIATFISKLGDYEKAAIKLFILKPHILQNGYRLEKTQNRRNA